MNIKRILNNDVTILLGKSDEGKTILMCNLIEEYKQKYKGSVYTFGFREPLIKALKTKPFNSLLELEQIKNSVIFLDEYSLILNLQDRKKRKQIEDVFRLVNHNGNKLFLCGLPDDGKKFICAKAKCFLFKGLNLSELINGSLAKEILLQYRGYGLGSYSFNMDRNKVLVYDGSYFEETFKYKEIWDTKKKNKDLFEVE